MAPRPKDTEATAARFMPVEAPIEVSRVVAFLDGSPFAERALPVAGWIAGELRVGLELVEVVSEHADADGAVRYLCGTANRWRASTWDVIVHEDVSAAMAQVVGHRRGAVPCLATHGRDRSAALLGSMAAALLARSPRPVLLAGPEAGPVEDPGAPVVVAVDCSAADDALMPAAMAWAVRLRRRLVIMTVAEPARPGYHERAARRRARGPADPDAYLAALADRAAASGGEVTSAVVHDAVSVRDGLVAALGRTAALLVLGTHHRQGLGRILLGSHAARVVHDAAIPALVVPSTSVRETTASLPRLAHERAQGPFPSAGSPPEPGRSTQADERRGHPGGHRLATPVGRQRPRLSPAEPARRGPCRRCRGCRRAAAIR